MTCHLLPTKDGMVTWVPGLISENSLAFCCPAQLREKNPSTPTMHFVFSSSAGRPIGAGMSQPRGGGVLSGKVGTGMCGPDGVLFRALRFCNGPFFI